MVRPPRTSSSGWDGGLQVIKSSKQENWGAEKGHATVAASSGDLDQVTAASFQTITNYLQHRDVGSQPLKPGQSRTVFWEDPLLVRQ